MSLFNRKQESDFDGQQKESSGKNKLSLLILLVLLGGFGYLYFFTSLIVPHEVPPSAPVASPEVKKSMPPKPAEQATAAAPATGDATKAEAAKNAALPAAPAPKQAAAVPVAAPAKPAPAQPQAVAKPVPPAPAPAKKDAPATAKKEEAPAKPAQAKPVIPAVKKEEPTAAKAASPVADKPVAKKKAVFYTISVGDFTAGEESAAAESKLAKTSIKPVRKQEMKKSRKMTRLFSGSYTDYDAYSAAMDKLKQSARGAFAIEKDGKYSVYAGSFSSLAGAEKEKKSLQAKGVSVQLQPVVLPLSLVKISAGHFTSKTDADKAAARLKAEGLAVKVLQAGK